MTSDLRIRSAFFRASTIREDDRSVEIVLASERVVVSTDPKTGQGVLDVLIVDGAELPIQMPMLDTHDRTSIRSVFGSIRELRVEGTEIVGRAYFADDPDSLSAWGKVRGGHVTDVSAGLQILEAHDIPAGRTRSIAGRSFTAPPNQRLSVYTRVRMREGSLVAVGADSSTKVRSENSMTIEAGGVTPPNDNAAVDAAAQERIRTEAITVERNRVAEIHRVAGDTRVAVVNRAINEGLAVADAQTLFTTENARVAEIRRLARADQSAELVRRAVDEGWSAGQAAQHFLEAVRSRSPAAPVGSAPVLDGPFIHRRSHETSCTQDVLGVALMIRSGRDPMARVVGEEQRRQRERIAEQAHQFRHMSMVDMCREAVRMSGGVVSYDRDEMIRTAVSTASLANIFTTNVNAALMASFDEVGDTTVGMVREEDVPNFQSNERASVGPMSGMTLHPRGGTAADATMSDTKEEYKVKRYSEKFVVDEQDIIDDRYGALMDSPELMGRACGSLKPDLFYSTVLKNPSMADGVAAFHASRGNLRGAGSALSAAALKAAVTAFMSQRLAGRTLNLRPSFLVAPTELMFTAAELLESAAIVLAGTAGTVTERGSKNVLADLKLEVRSDARLDATGVYDPLDKVQRTGSATNWYLFAQPGPGRTFVVGYLSGTGRRPVLNSYVLNQGQWGIGWAIKFDIGVKILGTPGIQKNTGES